MNFNYHNNVYWKVDGVVFQNKFDSLLYATQYKKDVSFHFFDDVWASFETGKLGLTSLTELYRRRAQQLRDEYDYLILYFSGGADSNNVLKSFLDNKIHLDEICVKWPMAVIDKKLYTPNSLDKTAFNYLSEWDFAIKPTLDSVNLTHPEIKITIADWSKNFSPNDYTEENFRKVNIWNDVETNFTLAHSENDLLLSQKGKKVGSIYGVDKPLISNINGNWLMGFTDVNIGMGIPLDHNQNSIEYFYWTPKMPELAYEQAYKLATFLEVDSKSKKFFYTDQSIQWDKDQMIVANQVQNDIIKSVVYDTWDFRFQTNKPIREDRTDKQSWIFSHPELRSHRDAFISVNSDFLSQIDQRFCLLENQGYQIKDKLRGRFKHCRTRWYFVKKENISVDF
jgi:hypothetical protein